MAALQLLAVLAYCLRRSSLPSTFFRPAWPGINAGLRREPEKMPMAALQLLAVLAYCLRRRALPSTFFRPAWPGMPVRTTGVFIWFAGARILVSGQNLRQRSINFIA
ncbi:hypothetical protein BA896_013100 [Janthinobacterium lividum]|uniref:Uncharacterized protein n=1 Tax=Janthinobacterium lividum TaxID=29581 RepID=A0A1E8PUU2_9BURK|nr:hypothetical protein BA896_013100 [Janthinobacterium lividum]